MTIAHRARLLLVIGASVLALASSATAQPAQTSTSTQIATVLGIGNEECESWLDYEKAKAGDTAYPWKAAQEAWVQGAISGASGQLFADSKFGGASKTEDFAAFAVNDNVFRWISDFCAAHPPYSLSQATTRYEDYARGMVGELPNSPSPWWKNK
jgi:hypothetical protein